MHKRCELIVHRKRNRNGSSMLTLTYNNKINIEYFISQKIPTITLKKENFLYGKYLNKIFDVNFVHNFYCFEISNDIDLTNNNIYFNLNEITSLYLFTLDLFSENYTTNKIYIIQKNSNIKKIYLGLIGQKKTIKVTIIMNDNELYYLNTDMRLNSPIYFEYLKCNKTYYIIENYKKEENNILNNLYIMINKYYGKIKLVYYNLTKDVNDEIQNGFVINDYNGENKIINIFNNYNLYILNCITPCAFELEFIYINNKIDILTEGQQITTYLPPRNIKKFNILLSDIIKNYIFSVEILNKNINNQLDINIINSDNINNEELSLGKDLNISNNYYYKKIMYCRNVITTVTLNSDTGTFINFFLTSNRLFNYALEGETIINKDELRSIAFKIDKNLLFDYISFNAIRNKKNITMKYGLKVISNNNLDENNKLLVPTPDISINDKNEIYLRFSNPYNKFDSINENDTNYSFYLLFSFELNNLENYPIYIDIRYNYDDKIIKLNSVKPEIIGSGKNYQIFGDIDYLNKDKILFNINKCNNETYSLINYYENESLIISNNTITNSKATIITNNLYYNSVIKLIKHSNNNENKISFFSQQYLNGDIYMNYFAINEKLFNELSMTKNNYTITFKDNIRTSISINWEKYTLSNSTMQMKTNYSLFILPKESKIITMCQLSQIPANYSFIDKNYYDADLSQGSYKVGIIASIISEEYPIIVFYDFVDIIVTGRINAKMIVFLAIFGWFLIMIMLICICRKKYNRCYKKNEGKLSPDFEESSFINSDESGVSESINNDIQDEHTER